MPTTEPGNSQCVVVTIILMISLIIGSAVLEFNIFDIGYLCLLAYIILKYRYYLKKEKEKLY